MTKRKFTYDKDSFVVFSTQWDKHYTFLITFDMQLYLSFTYLFPCKNYVHIYNHNACTIKQWKSHKICWISFTRLNRLTTSLRKLMRQNIFSLSVNNTVCGVFLCKLVCGNLVEFLKNLTELFRFVVHYSPDVNGKRIQTTPMFKKHLLLTRFLGYICLKWFVGIEIRFYTAIWKNSGLWNKVLWLRSYL